MKNYSTSCNHEFVSSTKGQRDGIGIRPVGKNKLNIGIRELKFEAELKTLPYPKNLKEAITLQLELRHETLENKYKQVFAFTLLKKFESFWLDFGCKSLDEWLSVMDMPSGVTLANREIIVRTFSKETFLLVGDDMLGEMMYLVASVQPDTEKRKNDYKAILNTYSKMYTVFDKTKFREIVNWYINTNYIKPTGAKIENVKAKPVRPAVVTGTAYTKRAVTLNTGKANDATLDFVVESRLCAGCVQRNKHIERLEAIIKRECGQEFVPVRPDNIRVANEKTKNN